MGFVLDCIVFLCRWCWWWHGDTCDDLLSVARQCERDHGDVTETPSCGACDELRWTVSGEGLQGIYTGWTTQGTVGDRDFWLINQWGSVPFVIIHFSGSVFSNQKQVPVFHLFINWLIKPSISLWARGLIQYKDDTYQYRKSHCGDKTILRPSCLHNGICYTGKTTSLYWIRAQVISIDDGYPWSTYSRTCWLVVDGLAVWEAGPWFNIKMSSYQYRKSHCGDKTVVRSSYLHNGISYTGKMTSLHWLSLLLLMARNEGIRCPKVHRNLHYVSLLLGDASVPLWWI